MNLFSKLRRGLVFSLLALALIMSGALMQVPGSKATLGPDRAAAATRYIVRWYYNDAAHTTRVGIGTFYCNGRASLSGRSTAYYDVVVNEPCCGTEVC
ncbi:MAG: hypothetical protein AB1489_19180 [Acidobacteriota bacterium]